MVNRDHNRKELSHGHEAQNGMRQRTHSDVPHQRRNTLGIEDYLTRLGDRVRAALSAMDRPGIGQPLGRIQRTVSRLVISSTCTCPLRRR